MTEKTNEIELSAYETALNKVQEKHAEYTPLNLAYINAMSAASVYEVNPDYVMKPADILSPSQIIAALAAGEMQDKGLGNAVAAGKIRKITAKKPAELITAEQSLTAALADYDSIVQTNILKFQFKKTRTGKSGSNDGSVGDNKQAEVIAQIQHIDKDAVVNFSGRRVFGTLSNGFTFNYDVYGQSYLNSIAKIVGHQ